MRKLTWSKKTAGIWEAVVGVPEDFTHTHEVKVFVVRFVGFGRLELKFKAQSSSPLKVD